MWFSRAPYRTGITIYGKKIFFSVGEASGDLYASIVIKQLINQGIKPSNIYAIGGAKIRETGIQVIRDISDLGVFGFTEGISSYFRIKKIYNKTKDMLEEIKPDIFIPVAFAGFNLPLVKFAHNLNIKVIYFVPPQLWAWGKFRSRMLKKYCTKVICLFPFEQKFYERLGINAIYLGNPLIDYVKTHFTKQEVARLLNFDNQTERYTTDSPRTNCSTARSLDERDMSRIMGIRQLGRGNQETENTEKKILLLETETLRFASILSKEFNLLESSPTIFKSSNL